MTHFLNAKSTSFSTILAISLSLVHEIQSRFQYISADWQSGFWERTLPSQNPGYRRKQSSWPWTLNDSWPFCSWRIWCFPLCCHLVSRSCVNIQVSSQGITSLNKPGSFWVCCSAQMCWSFSCNESSVQGYESFKINHLSYCTNTQHMVFSNYISHVFVVVGDVWCARMTWAVIVFHSFRAFQKSSVPFENTWTRHAVFTISLSQ